MQSLKIVGLLKELLEFQLTLLLALDATLKVTLISGQLLLVASEAVAFAAQSWLRCLQV